MHRTSLVIAMLLLPARVLAQGDDLVLSEDEISAFQLFQLERYVNARELAEEIIERDERSIVGQAVLGMVQHMGEGNLPRSLYRFRLARSLLEERFGREPTGPMAREWHSMILQEMAFTAGEMERFDEELAIWDDYDKLYDPDRPGERLWPLIMLRRFDEGRRWASKALASGDSWSHRQAMNGLCALENEAGNRGESYRWCTAHAAEVEDISGFGGVYFCNAGESARGLFRLDEAERYYLEATQREVEWYANPWMFLADLYLRAGRLPMAAQALRSMHEYNRQRPPHTQQQDQSERHRAVAGMYIVAGLPEKALPLTERAVLYPDRRGGQSRSPEADLATNALLDRRALLDAAEVALEESSTGGFVDRWVGRLRAAYLRARAFRSERRVVALMSDTELLRGMLEAEGPDSFGTPPWLVADLIDVVGAGPVEAALNASKAEAPAEVPMLLSYLDAYGAEAAAARGDWQKAADVARRVSKELPQGEALLRARLRLILARALESSGQLEEASSLYLEVLQTDPTLLRRTGKSIPVAVASAGDRLSRRTADLLSRSPRIRTERESPLRLQVQSEGGSTCHVCLTFDGSDVGCSTDTVDSGTELEEAARQCVEQFHRNLLAPRVDLSLIDASSLDGSTTSGTIDDIMNPGGP